MSKGESTMRSAESSMPGPSPAAGKPVPTAYAEFLLVAYIVSFLLGLSVLSGFFVSGDGPLGLEWPTLTDPQSYDNYVDTLADYYYDLAVAEYAMDPSAKGNSVGASNAMELYKTISKQLHCGASRKWKVLYRYAELALRVLREPTKGIHAARHAEALDLPGRSEAKLLLGLNYVKHKEYTLGANALHSTVTTLLPETEKAMVPSYIKNSPLTMYLRDCLGYIEFARAELKSGGRRAHDALEGLKHAKCKGKHIKRATSLVSELGKFESSAPGSESSARGASAFPSTQRRMERSMWTPKSIQAAMSPQHRVTMTTKEKLLIVDAFIGLALDTLPGKSVTDGDVLLLHPQPNDVRGGELKRLNLVKELANALLPLEGLVQKGEYATCEDLIVALEPCLQFYHEREQIIPMLMTSNAQAKWEEYMAYFMDMVNCTPR